MKLRLTRSTNLASSSHGDDNDQDRQEVAKHPDGDDHDAGEGRDSISGANNEKEEEKIVVIMLGRHAPAAESLSLTIVEESKEMFFRLGFFQTVGQKLVDDQRIDFPWILSS